MAQGTQASSTTELGHCSITAYQSNEAFNDTFSTLGLKKFTLPFTGLIFLLITFQLQK